jgi:serine/threonine protein kinase
MAGPRIKAPREVGGFVLGRRLGSGTFGEVYYGSRGKEEVAVKLEVAGTKRSQLLNEWGLYNSLAGGPGVPQVFWHGKVGPLNALVMELLGPSLEELMKRCDHVFSPKTVLMCADQMTQRLHYVHSKGILHRDIKPQNFLVGRGENATQIYLVDFGLSKYYTDQETGKHAPYRTGRKGLTGTARYTSIGNHLGIEPSRRDDLQGLCYVLLRMARGSLPWQGIKAPTKKERNERILLKKVRTAPEDLCSGLPQELLEYYLMCQKLQYSEQPPYSELLSLIRGGLARRQLQYDLVFDWRGASTSEDVSSHADHAESDQSTAEKIRETCGRPEVREVKCLASELKRKAGDIRGGPLDCPSEGIKQSKIEPR